MLFRMLKNNITSKPAEKPYEYKFMRQKKYRLVYILIFIHLNK